MKKWLCLLLLLFPCICFAQESRQQSNFFPASNNVHIYFDGEWIPDADPTHIGPKNFKTLKNYRYRGSGKKSTGIVGTLGYDEINSDIPDPNYYIPRSGYHHVKYYPAESHLLVQFYHPSMDYARIYVNETPIPNEGNFKPIYLYEFPPFTVTEGVAEQVLVWEDTETDQDVPLTQWRDTYSDHALLTQWMNVGTDSEAGTTTIVSDVTVLKSRFSPGPRSHVLHSDGEANHIWQGHETQIAAFLTSTTTVTEYVTNPKDYTYEVSNTIDDDNECASLLPDNGTTTYFLAAFTRPISGITPYVKVANDVPGVKVYAKEWTGTSWSELETTDNTNGLTVLDGSAGISFSSTVDTSKPKFLADRLLYFYEFRVETASGISLYHLTGDVPWQEIKDIWDGIPRQPISVQVSRDEGNTYDDYTISVQQSYPEYEIGAQIGNADHMILVFEDRIQALKLEMISGNTKAMDDYSSIYFWSGTTWTPPTTSYDGTYDDSKGVTPFNRTGVLTWSPPDAISEFKRETFGVYGWSYKVAWNEKINSGGDTPDKSDAIVDVIYGIPAPLKVPPFKFVSLHANRVMLCGYLKGNEANRVDFSAAEAPDVYNGSDSSYNNTQSLYFGKGAELTAAASIFNRYGSDVEAFWVVFTADETFVLRGSHPDRTRDDYFKIEEVSSTYGCPAPFTLTRADMGFEMIEGELERNVLMWLAGDGPKRFDGLTPSPILGIDHYFDENDPNYVGAAAIEDSHAWFDPNHKEWNLRVASYWFAYDMIKRKWFEKDTGAYEEPSMAVPVIDTDGNEYVYGGIDTGYMVRLEYGPTWGDGGGAISHVWETGDFYADGLGWNQTIIGRMRLEHRAITEETAMLIEYFKDASDSGTSLFSIPLYVAENTYTDLNRTVWNVDKTARYHRFKGTVETDETTYGLAPLAWGFQYSLFSEDR
jgi:hypothetical protein